MTSLPIAWRILELEVNGKAYVGQRGVRDPEFPCEGFEPGKPTISGRCETDGHYVCDECVERATCGGCGKRPTQCECKEAQ